MEEALQCSWAAAQRRKFKQVVLPEFDEHNPNFAAEEPVGDDEVPFPQPDFNADSDNEGVQGENPAANVSLIVLHNDVPADRDPDNGYRYGNSYLGLLDDTPLAKEIANYSYFCKVWRADKEVSSKCKVRKYLPFAKCDDCSKFKKAEEETVNQLQRKALRAIQTQHIQDVKRERAKYAENKAKAIAQPETYMSIVIDGADQSDHDLPHFATKSHISDAAWKVKMHLIGAIVHGIGVYAYTCPSHVKQGHNVTIQALWDTIVQVKQKNGGWLAPNLLLQLDNTTKQNKGNGLFSFLALLVAQGVFKTIEVSFLPVGHTHCDIDQLFSRVAVYLRSHDAFSRQEFAFCIQCAFRKMDGKLCTVMVYHWESVGNISDWLKNRHSKFVGVTLFYHFKFSTHKSTDVSVVRDTVWCQARCWPGDPTADWQGLDGNSYFLDVFPAVFPPPVMADEWHLIPPAQFKTHDQGLEKGQKINNEKMIAKMTSGLKELSWLTRRFANNSSAFLDCMKIVDLMSLPLTQPIPFHWKKEDLTYLAAAPEPAPNVEVPGFHDHEDRFTNNRPKATVPEKGKHYIMRPNPAYDYQDKFKELFWIALCTNAKVKRGGDGADKNDVGYMMKKLEVDWDDSRPLPDPYNLRYCFFKGSKPDFEGDIAVFQDIVAMTNKKTKTFWNIYKNTKKLQAKFKSYVEQWKEQLPQRRSP